MCPQKLNKKSKKNVNFSHFKLQNYAKTDTHKHGQIIIGFRRNIGFGL